MLKSVSPSSTRTFCPRFRRTGSRRLQKKIMYNPYIYSSNDEMILDLYQQKQELVNELKVLSKEVDNLKVELEKSEIEYEQEVEKTTKTSNCDKTLTKQEKIDLEKFEQNATRVSAAQANVEELEMQVKLMKSLFSDENLEKLRQEVEKQKYEHECVLGEIQNITEETELLLLNLNSDQISEKIQDTMAMKSLVKHYKTEIKTLDQEGKELMREAKELQENDPIDNNVKKLQILRESLKRIQNKRAIHERNVTSKEKRNMEFEAVVDTMNKAIEDDKIKTKRERERMAYIKENTDFNAHTMMPLETTIKWKETKNDENFFEITQQQENIVPEEEAAVDDN